MNYEIIDRYFILWETVEMLQKYINGVSFQTILGRQKAMYGNVMSEEFIWRLETLQSIMEEVCKDVDISDSRIRFYFGWENNGDFDEESCLAGLMVHFRHMPIQAGFREHVDLLRQKWAMYQEQGFWICKCERDNLIFTREGECPGDLFKQVLALRMSAEHRLQLYDVLRDYDAHMLELADLIEPYALRLDACLRRNPRLMDGTLTYWKEHFSQIHPLDILPTPVLHELKTVRKVEELRELRELPETVHVMFSFMKCTELFYGFMTDDFVSIGEAYNYMCIGCSITTVSTPRPRGVDIESVSTIMKAICDKKRLEVLRRLSRKRSYCQELAASMGVDQGNMSRILTALNNYGFLIQEKDGLKNYYQTDRDTLREFLRTVEMVVLD